MNAVFAGPFFSKITICLLFVSTCSTCRNWTDSPLVQHKKPFGIFLFISIGKCRKGTFSSQSNKNNLSLRIYYIILISIIITKQSRFVDVSFLAPLYIMRGIVVAGKRLYFFHGAFYEELNRPPEKRSQLIGRLRRSGD